MRIVFIGCVEFSRVLLERILDIPSVQVTGVVTRDFSDFNTDFCSLRPQAEAAGIPCLIDQKNSQELLASWLGDLSPDAVYCFGWPYILKPEILKIPRLGVVGYHPTALPQNRGRHPIIWTLALGLKKTASTFFIMDEGADSGDIISQEIVNVSEVETAGSLYKKLLAIALLQVEEFTTDLANGNVSRIPQDHSKSNYWRKRSKADGKIDFRMPAAGIYNLIRALTKPYAGAHIDYAGTEVKVWESEIPSTSQLTAKLANLEPGTVLVSGESGLDVRCGDGVIRILKHEFKSLPKVGTYL